MVEWVFYTLLYRKNPLFNLLCLWNHTHILYLMLNRDTVLGFTTTLKFIPIFTHITHSRNRSSYIKSPPIYIQSIHSNETKQNNNNTNFSFINIYTYILLHFFRDCIHTDTHRNTYPDHISSSYIRLYHIYVNIQ